MFSSKGVSFPLSFSSSVHFTIIQMVQPPFPSNETLLALRRWEEYCDLKHFNCFILFLKTIYHWLKNFDKLWPSSLCFLAYLARSCQETGIVYFLFIFTRCESCFYLQRSVNSYKNKTSTPTLILIVYFMSLESRMFSHQNALNLNGRISPQMQELSAGKFSSGCNVFKLLSCNKRRA